MSDYGLGERNFDSAFDLGVEEELLLVDEDNVLLDRGRAAIEQVRNDDAEQITGELFRSMLETRSEISRNAREAVADLGRLRRELIDTGARLIGAGLHPGAEPGDSKVDRAPRYELIGESLRGILRTPICGQHIHVGMPDQETAVRAYCGIRLWLPLLNALASNSPFWGGEDSGLASARTAIFRSYPRAAMAPAADDFESYVKIVAQVCRAGGLEDYSHIWWDVRIHPKLGTIEVRVADTQFDLRRSAALAALTHCLARVEAENDHSTIPVREALAESMFQATRHGLGAELLDREGCPVPARQLAQQAVAESASAAAELGCETELRGVEAILADGSGAEIQRRVHAEGGIEGLLTFLVEETAQLAVGTDTRHRNPVSGRMVSGRRGVPAPEHDRNI